MHYNTHPLVFTWIEQKKPLFVSSSLIGLLSPTLVFMEQNKEASYPFQLTGLLLLTGVFAITPLVTKHMEYFCCSHNRSSGDSTILGITQNLLALSLAASTGLNAISYGIAKTIPLEISVSLASISTGISMYSGYRLSENLKSQKLEDLERQVLRV